MKRENWKQVKQIFNEAAELIPEERPAFLAEACRDDGELRREVDKLLEAYQSDFLEQPLVEKSPESDMRPSTGQHFGHYEIIRQIGAGGMGEVYLAKDRKLDRQVALKVLNQDLHKHEINRSRFIQEAQAASGLNHPNILIIHEISETENIHFIVSEYIEGQTLREIIHYSPLNLERVLDIAAQIAGALVRAHEAHLVHRDIKPENIMVRPDGLVKILDFGLAKLIEQKNPVGDLTAELIVKNKTAKGIILGTVSYMSPEQVKGEKLDERTDIFSFGSVLYEMIAGKTPFGCESLVETWTKLLHSEPEALSHLVPGISGELQSIVAKMLRKNRDERYQTMKGLLADLQAFKKRVEFEAELERSTPPDRPMREKTVALDKTAALAVKPTIEIRESVPNNLSENLPPIIGREKEIEEIQDLLNRSDVRLLTLTGVGGTGKTKLAKTVAGRSLMHFKDGVFFVELAAITNPELVASSIAQQLGSGETSGKPILETLKDFLREKQILLVIDNFEQVTDAAPIIAELLAAAKRLKIIVTSRVLLHLSAEREFIVAPLAVPTRISQVPLEEFLKYEAVKLFVEQAQNAKPGFVLTEENAGSVAEICARLDGLPLAIELAAARVKILSPAAILAKLENRLKLLTGGARDLPAHQQTMRGTLEWSYQLLQSDEKVLFRRLAVFVGGFDFEAAEMVCRTDAAAATGDESGESVLKARKPKSEIEVLDGLTSLIDKSLLVSRELPDGEMRFRMLEVVREFALETLETSGEMERLEKRHAAYFLKLAEAAEPHLQTAKAAEWLDRLEVDYDNLRTVLQWSLAHEADILTRIAAAIPQFWGIRSSVFEGSRWLEVALDQCGKTPSEVRFKLINWLVLFRMFGAEYERAHKLAKIGLAEAETVGDKKFIGLACRNLGRIAYQQNNLEGARHFYEKGLVVDRQIDYPMGLAYSLSLLGDVFRVEGHRAKARLLFEEALVVLRKINNWLPIAANLNNLGGLAFEDGDYQAAYDYFSEGFVIAQKIDDKISRAYFLDGFAAYFLKQGDLQRAAKLAGAAESLFRSADWIFELAEKQFRENYLSELRAAMSEEEFKAGFEEGGKLALEEVAILFQLES